MKEKETMNLRGLVLWRGRERRNRNYNTKKQVLKKWGKGGNMKVSSSW